jgi:hypothetical protein
MPATSPAFSSLGDNANYFRVPAADFEGRLGGWSLTPGTSVVQGNESSFVGGSSDSHSLNINSGGQAVSPVVCVSSLFPAWRFFANAANTNPGTTLHVSAQFTTNTGETGVVPVTDLGGGTFNSWAATSSLPLGSTLASGTTENVRFVFSADPAGAGWHIDDVYVDPYAR